MTTARLRQIAHAVRVSPITRFLLQRLTEKSTWVQIFAVALAVFGIHVAPAWMALITTVGMITCAAVGAVTQGDLNKPTQTLKPLPPHLAPELTSAASPLAA